MHFILRWLRYLWSNEDGFFGIGMGPSSQEKQQYAGLAGIANFGTSQGEGDILAADNFWKAILSGDPTQMSKVLGPEFSGINKRGQESKKTASEFGNRGGGTNAGMQMTDDKTRSSIDELISNLTGHAASALGASGSGLLSVGASAHDAAFSQANTMQQQRLAQLNDLFKSIASVAAAPFTGGASLGGLTGSGPQSFSLPGGGGGGGIDLSSVDEGKYGGF